MAGYSGTPLVRKLGIKPGHLVLLDALPPGIDLGDLGPVRRATRARSGLEVVVSFHTEMRTLDRRLPALARSIAPDGMVWLCWPKRAAQPALAQAGLRCDIDENRVRRAGLGAGLVDVKVAAIDEVWSGLKFVRRLADR